MASKKDRVPPLLRAFGLLERVARADGPMALQSLATDSAFARGRWILATTDGKEQRGVFTLLLRKLPDGWRIVHDHSSM